MFMCERVLEWREGYYNGDIKTRKTVQAMELEMKGDKIGLQRSEQLKELYKFLLAGEAEPHTKRPSAALAPEDLSDLEWYYLVCMSFVFSHNQRYHYIIPYYYHSTFLVVSLVQTLLREFFVEPFWLKFLLPFFFGLIWFCLSHHGRFSFPCEVVCLGEHWKLVTQSGCAMLNMQIVKFSLVLC